MGIKGRKKRERERAAAEAVEFNEEGDASVSECVRYDDGGGDSGIVVMGNGPMKPPIDSCGRIRMKKTEFFNMQDLSYLDRLAEEHANRRTTHLRRKEANNDVRGALEEAEKLLLHHFSSEADIQTLAYRDQSDDTGKKRLKHASDKGEESVSNVCTRSAAVRAPFCHPLIGINTYVVNGLKEEGFDRMTIIQERSIPYALQGYDLLGQAQTGSGKTLAFCVPVLHGSIELVGKRPNFTYSLILAPTKELCVQTHTVLKGICQHIPSNVASFSVHLITGGTKITEERQRLSAGVSIVVGTPGRVHDHVQHCAKWDLSRLRYLVLDEADRMLADGFQRSLDAIVRHLPRSRQTFLFSATNSKSVGELARLSLSRTPLFISTNGNAPTTVPLDGEAVSTAISSTTLPPYCSYDDPDSDEGEDTSNKSGSSMDDKSDNEPIPSTLRQFCHITPVDQRLICLYTFVKRVARTSKAMVFCSTVASTIFHCQMMGSVGFHNEVMMLHGQMKHRQRVSAFQVFNEWKTGVLMCTDVAARGLDIPNVEWILQYDPPLDPTEYIHRIGRTARAGNIGNALLFLIPEEVTFVRYLAKFGIKLEKYPMPPKLPPIQMKLEHVLQLDPIVAKSAVSAFRAHVGAYQSHLLQQTFSIHRLDLGGLARGFALSTVPNVSLASASTEAKRQAYIKGKLKSLNRRRLEAKRYYESQKTRRQWTEDGQFVGIVPPKA